VFTSIEVVTLILATGKINNVLSEIAITILGKEKLVLFVY